MTRPPWTRDLFWPVFAPLNMFMLGWVSSPRGYWLSAVLPLGWGIGAALERWHKHRARGLVGDPWADRRLPPNALTYDDLVVMFDREQRNNARGLGPLLGGGPSEEQQAGTRDEDTPVDPS